MKFTNLMKKKGEKLEPYEFLVTPEFNQQYLFAVEDFHPRYWDEKYGQPIVHPSLLLNQSNATRSPGFCLPPGVAAIHTQDETQFINPGKVGKRFKVTWEIVEEYDKRGRHYQVIDTVVVDEDGTEILRRRAHVTYFQGKGGE